MSNSNDRDLFKLLGKFEREQKMPPIKDWHPQIESEIDINIDNQGRWFHEGGHFDRQDLARLFSSILIKENDQYFLITPVEKLRIKVDDVPFKVVLMKSEECDGQAQISFITSLGDEVVAGKDNRIEFRQHGKDWVPYVEIRDDLWARLSQSVYYELMNLAQEQEDGYYLQSAGEFFKIPE